MTILSFIYDRNSNTGKIFIYLYIETDPRMLELKTILQTVKCPKASAETFKKVNNIGFIPVYIEIFTTDTNGNIS